MQVDIDILVYAVIAALLLGRLWAVLGSRNEDEPERPNPFVQPPQPPIQDKAASNSDTPPTSLPPRLPPAVLPPASLAGGLAQVSAIDQTFEEKQFLQNARDIFTAIVGAYAAGNLDTVSEFLAPALEGHFQQAANMRIANGQTAQSRIARIKDAEVLAARAEGSRGYITVKFISDQENVLRDTHGTVIGGAEGTLEEVTDIWVFSKDTQVPGARWIVVETRS